MNPIQILIDDALDAIRELDPSWDDAQPRDFRAKVVSSWKDSITTELNGTMVVWSMRVGAREFVVRAGIFANFKTCYNPYATPKCFCI